MQALYNGPHIPPQLCIVPYIPYKLGGRQFGLTYKMPASFTVNGRPGAPLKPIAPLNYNDIDDSRARIFEGCGTKITYVVQIAGYKPFKQQKYAHTGGHHTKVSCDRAKVLRQVAEVMEAFMQSSEREICKGPLQFGQGGIRLEDLFLVELIHVSKSSFQPILAIESIRASPALLGQTLRPQREAVKFDHPFSQGNFNSEGDVLEDKRLTVVAGDQDIWQAGIVSGLM